MRIRHALEQTLAAGRLEGWQPGNAEVAALAGLLGGVMTFGEYLAPHLNQPRARVRRPLLARRRPYFIPGTTVLRNSFGVSDPIILDRLEFVAAAGRTAQVHGGIAGWPPDVQRLHQHVFGDVYAWAGVPRIVELRRGGSSFLDSAAIPASLMRLSDEIAELAMVVFDDSALVFQLSRIYAEYNRIHPFREGNGRTGTLLLHILAYRAGRRLDLRDIEREQWIAASRESMLPWRDGSCDPRPIAAVLQGAVSRWERG